MAILTKGMTLGYKVGSATGYTNLTNLQEIPSLGGSPDKVDITTLADGSKRYMNGIKDYGDLAFKFIYEEDQFSELDSLGENTIVSWQVGIPDGASGAIGTKATFTGSAVVSLDSASVGAALTYTLTIALDSDIDFN